ncbi:hypothetical protein RchiOBHm_Chr5g0021631 [Rosa chinensis]|uniref:Transmembrane protein n=1 Tax=Rosa chinensis TaxID=74649 RepID=A0A2P6Q7K2_ROSCH|nr:hypothetical protein RchiOBHm_Chr5g0021631 [Rosa chinensis]
MAQKKTCSSSVAYLIPFIFLLFLLLCSQQIAFARVSKLSKSKFESTSTIHQQIKIHPGPWGIPRAYRHG